MRRSAPIENKGLAPYDTAWLRNVVDGHLVSHLCKEAALTACQDSVLTTYLSLDDPHIWAGEVIVEVWETALNPALCKRRNTLVDHQGASLTLSKDDAGWMVKSHGLMWHATGSCELVREPRR